MWLNRQSPKLPLLIDQGKGALGRLKVGMWRRWGKSMIHIGGQCPSPWLFPPTLSHPFGSLQAKHQFLQNCPLLTAGLADAFRSVAGVRWEESRSSHSSQPRAAWDITGWFWLFLFSFLSLFFQLPSNHLMWPVSPRWDPSRWLSIPPPRPSAQGTAAGWPWRTSSKISSTA